jgi:ribosomal protein S18 acetylase RimI-like enzyme
MPLTIRRATPSDVHSMASILLEAFEEFRPLYTDRGFAATTPSASVISARLDEGPSWVALLNHQIVGTVSAIATPEGLYIRSMGVEPSARRRGIAKILLYEVEAYAAVLDFKTLLLSTTPFLDSAIRLYEQYGFVRTDAGPHDLFGTPLFTMTKKTAQAGDAASCAD